MARKEHAMGLMRAAFLCEEGRGKLSREDMIAVAMKMACEVFSVELECVIERMKNVARMH